VPAGGQQDGGEQERSGERDGRAGRHAYGVAVVRPPLNRCSLHLAYATAGYNGEKRGSLGLADDLQFADNPHWIPGSPDPGGRDVIVW
jgi:hypothetical protein